MARAYRESARSGCRFGAQARPLFQGHRGGSTAPSFTRSHGVHGGCTGGVGMAISHLPRVLRTGLPQSTWSRATRGRRAGDGITRTMGSVSLFCDPVPGSACSGAGRRPAREPGPSVRPPRPGRRTREQAVSGNVESLLARPPQAGDWRRGRPRSRARGESGAARDCGLPRCQPALRATRAAPLLSAASHPDLRELHVVK